MVAWLVALGEIKEEDFSIIYSFIYLKAESVSFFYLGSVLSAGGKHNIRLFLQSKEIGRVNCTFQTIFDSLIRGLESRRRCKERL
jgi:hypothetical protein